MILYIENPKDSTKNLLKVINEFSEVAGHKINIQKSDKFLYTYNELSENETSRNCYKGHIDNNKWGWKQGR